MRSNRPPSFRPTLRPAQIRRQKFNLGGDGKAIPNAEKTRERPEPHRGKGKDKE